MARRIKNSVNGEKKSISTPVRIGVAGAVVAVAVGGGTAAAAHKTVTLDVDGEIRQVSTISNNADKIVNSAGIELSDSDDLIAQERVSAGDEIVVRTAKPVSLVVDGQPNEVTTNSATIGEFFEENPEFAAANKLSANTKIPSEGLTLDLTTPRPFELLDDGVVANLALPATTVGEALAMRGIHLQEGDSVEPALEAPLEPGMFVEVKRTVEKNMREVVEIEAPEDVIEDPEMYEDEVEVIEEGTPGTRLATFKIVSREGEELSRDEIDGRDLEEAVAAVVRKGTKPRSSAPAVAGGSVWDTLAECESNGNWAIDSGNGFSGGLQFHPQTWQAHGGGEFAPNAAQASREEQIVVAERVQASQGWGAWPACTAAMGLR